MEKRRIIFVCLKLSNGGAERVLSVLANHFALKEYEVDFIVLFKSDFDYEILPQVNVTDLKWANPCGLFGYIRRLKQLRKIIVPKSGVVITFLFRSIFWVSLATAFSDTKKIFSERNDPRKDPNKLYKRILRNICYLFADGIVFQTNEQRNLFSPKIRSKGMIIENPIVDELPKYEEKGSNTIISVCRLEPQKNIKCAIDAFETIHDIYQDYQFLIYGRGSLEDKISEYIRAKRLEKYVKLKGFQKNIYEQMKTATIFVSSSNYEGMSNAVLEAMAIGLPVVCTDCPIGGNRKLIHDGENGFLVPCDDPKAISDCVKKLITDIELRKYISLNAMKIREQYSISKVVAKWEDFLRILS